MSNKTYNGKRGRMPLLTLLAAAMLLLSGAAKAQDKVSITDFTIKPEETKTVAVNLDNPEHPMSTLQMDIIMPRGVYYIDNSLKRNEERVSRNTHTIHMQHVGTTTAYKEGTTDKNAYEGVDAGLEIYRLFIAPAGRNNMNGTTGAVVYFDVYADYNFTMGDKISVRSIFGSSYEPVDENGHTPLYEMPDFDVNTAAYVGKLYATEDTLAIKPDSTYRKISVAMDNFIDVYGFQADITLPKGVSIETREDGSAVLECGERIPQNMAITSNTREDGKISLIISGLTAEAFNGATGVVFSFNVKADETLPLKSDIEFSNVIVSAYNARTYLINDVKGTELTNSFLAHYTPANDSIQALRDNLAETEAKIAEVAPDVKDSEEMTTAKTAIVTMTDNLQTAVDNAYDDYTLASNYNEVMAPAAEIIAATEKLLEDAVNAQAAYVLDSCYTTANDSVQALREMYAETVAEIDEVAPDVKDSETLTEAKAAIETMLGDLQKSVDEAYADETLPAEYEEVMAPSEEIIAAIEKLLEDAIAEQEKHDIETGIDGVWTTADDMSGVKVFTLSGTQVDTPAKGQVNILKYPDGTVKKVFVK